MNTNDSKIKSLVKALSLLDCFSIEKNELGVTELSNMLGLYKSNVHNIISTFEDCGYIVKNNQTGKYRLGLKILQLSHIVSSSIEQRNIIHKCVDELAEQICEIVYFGIPDDDKVMYIDGSFPGKSYNTRWIHGMTAPLYCTGIGKAMLAYMSDDTIGKIISKGLISFTDATITEPESLYAELKLIRERGYSVDNMEHEYGVKCVGVPIFNHRNELVGAISTTGPSLRFEKENIKLFSELIINKSEYLKKYL